MLVLRLIMEKNPLVMWVDSDVMFRDLDWNLTEFLDEHMEEGKDILTANDMVTPFVSEISHTPSSD